MEKKYSSLLLHFQNLKDPRINRRKLYPLTEVLLIVLCGVICGAESWRDFVIFGHEKLDFFKQHLEFKNGIPSKNTFARVLSAIDPKEFKICFINWVKELQETFGEVIAIDGKELRHSFDNAKGKSAIHMISAFASSTRLVLGQEKVSDKSNEITAIPKLLNLLELEGAIVSIDAAGCQKAIAKKIIDKGANYVLALKGNQGTLHADVKLYLDSICDKNTKNIDYNYAEEVEKAHGRIEQRRYWVTGKIDWLEQKSDWANLKSIGVVESVREIRRKATKERRYYLISKHVKAQEFGAIVRRHWGIENILHWTLDVVFREDDSRIRTRCAAENIAIIRHVAFNLLQLAKGDYKDVSLKALRKKAGWGNDTLFNILMQKF